MKKRRSIPSSLFPIIVLFVFSACNSGNDYSDIPTDSATVAKGRNLFTQNCSACHDINRDGIGPHLGGVTQAVSPEWLKMFIRNPQAVLESGDERGKALLTRYKTTMPSFSHYSDEELTEIIAYLHTEKTSAAAFQSDTALALTDPIPGEIAQSDLLVAVEFVAEIPASSDKGFKTRITKLDFIPGTDRRFVVDIRGKLHELRNGKPEVYMDMAVLKDEFIDAPGLATGFGSFAFHPEFLKNGLLYTGHTETPRKVKADFHYADSIPAAVTWVVTEWTADDPTAFTFKGKSRELFRIDMVTGIHGMQELTFNPNSKPGDEDYGLLYIGIGDGGAVQSGYPFLVENFRPWGSIFRIDPRGNNSANKQYGIPPGNPFAGSDKGDAFGEIYANGFRNPHRITWTQAGQMLATNIGQGKIEEVNLIEKGHHYGWPIREGTFLMDPHGDIEKVYALPEDDARYGVTYPVGQYDHDDGAAVTGGFEYTGTAIPGLRGKYLFADMNNGRLYYLDLAEVKQGSIATVREWKITHNGAPITTEQLHNSKRVDLRFGKDHQGDVYIFSKQDGRIYRLASATTAITKL